MPVPCVRCETGRAVILRPKNREKLCKTCFISIFEDEIHETITKNNLFYPGERVAIGASGGKDSTVLASVLKTLNERHNYGVQLNLLSIDEGIKGYRDDSLETVKRNSQQYDMPLTIVGYDQLYGWTMDQVVEQIGKKGNCTYCGVFRRQALDRGAAMLGIKHIVTGHNADDFAETVMMNILRGDLPRLHRSMNIITQSAASEVKRSKPLKYTYEKEIVLYAHHKKLDYFVTECIYSPEAFRGSARTLIKDLERLDPRTILNVIQSGEDMAKLVPAHYRGEQSVCSSSADLDGDEQGSAGCGSSKVSADEELAQLDKQLKINEESKERETEVSSSNLNKTKRNANRKKQVKKQELRKCVRCGYLSSQDVCKTCLLLEGLNKTRPKITIESDEPSSGDTSEPLDQLLSPLSRQTNTQFKDGVI